MPVFKISASLLIYSLSYIISKLYLILAYAKSFTEKLALLFETNSFQSLANFNVKKNLKVCVVAPIMDNMKYCSYISIKKFAICDI